MFLAAHAAVIAFQWLVCVVTAAGWGYWIYRLCGRPADQSGNSALLCALAGWCAGWLVLQNAAILGARLRWSAPVGAIFALAGIVGWHRDHSGGGPPLGVSLPFRGPATKALKASAAQSVDLPAPGAERFPALRSLLWPLPLLAAVFVFQAAGLIYAGAGAYYGYARQDQVNYVQSAEFLVEKPYSTTRAQVGLHPWIVKGVDMKDQRIGESIANGYLAAVTGTDASRTYGTISIFFVALIATSVAGCLLAYGVCPRWAWLGGAWAGLLPGVTQIQLDGFLSQTSTVFCFVGIVWALRLATGQPRLAALASALFLGFLLSAYSEEYLLGLGLALLLIATAPGVSLRRKFGIGTAALLLPWGCLSPFARGIAGFIAGQYQAARHAGALAVWQPRAGTWRGWNELFLAAPAHHPGLLAAARLAGMGLLIVAAIGAAPSAAPGSAQRLVLAVFPAAVLGALVWYSRPVFPVYPFGKLAVSFSPLVIVLVVFAAGLPARRWLRSAAWLIPLLLVFAAWSSWTKLAVVFHNGEGLQTVNLPSARAVYRELEAHPERTYLITEPHGLLASWMAYYGRDAKVYSAVPIGDSSMDPAFAFLQKPPPGIEIWAVSHDGVQRR